MTIVVGSVSVDVIPNATSFAKDLRGQIEGPVDAVGQEVGQNLADAVVEHLADAIPAGLAEGVPESGEIGGVAGAQFGDRFSTEIRTRIDAALKSLPEANIDLDDSEAFAKISDLRDQLIELGYHELDISIDDDGAIVKIQELRTEFAALALESPDIRVRVDAAAAQLELDRLLAKLAALDAARIGAGVEGDLATLGAEAENVTNQFTKAGGSVNGLAIGLGAAAVLVGPILGALAGDAAGLYLGIKNANVETDGLQSAWQNLETEVGRAVSPGIQVAVDNLTRALPQLEPLVVDLSESVTHGLDAVTHWLGDGGVKTIVGYLVDELPVVNNLFEQGGLAVGHFLADTQSGANDLISSLGGVIGDLNSIDQLRNSISSSIPGTSTSGTGVKGFFEGIGASLTGNPQGALHSGSILGGVVEHDVLGKIGDLPGLFENKPVKPAKSLTSEALNQATSLVPGEQGLGLNAQQLQQATGGLDANSTALEANAKAANETIRAYQTAQAAAAQFALETAQNTGNLSAENNAAGLLSAALQGLAGDNLGVAQSGTAFQQSILAVNTSIKQNGTAFQGNSAAALANQAALESAVGAAQAHAQAVAQNTESVSAATSTYNADITALENQVGASGKAKQAIEDYVKQIGYIPTVVQTQLEIQAQIDVRADLVDTANLGRTLHDVVNSMDGNFLQFYADGAHVAQMAPAGAMRVWAEPETGGESYIPHALSKRARSEAILSETANLFGGTYVPRDAHSYADGLVLAGTMGRSSGGYAGPPIQLHNHNSLTIGRREIVQLTKEVTELQMYNRTRL